MPYNNRRVRTITTVDAIRSSASDAGTGALGSIMLSCVGYGAIAVAAGSLGTVALACSVGGLLVLLPYALLQERIHSFGENHYRYSGNITYNILSLLLNTSAAVGAALVGSAMLGLTLNPIMCCALAGALTLNALKILKTTLDIIGLIVQKTINLLNTPIATIVSDAASVVHALNKHCWNLLPSFENTPKKIPSAPEEPAESFDNDNIPIARAVLLVPRH